MTLDLSSEEWTQVRYEYEHTDKPVDEIGLDHGVSPSTLRDRVRRWRWTRRRQPVSAEGPPPMPIEYPVPLVPAVAPIGAAAPLIERAAPIVPAVAPTETAANAPAHAATSAEAPPDPAGIVPRLQSAVARVLPAIEATVAKLAAGPMPPREMERAARTITSLTRTLRELNELLSQHQARAVCDCDDDMPEDMDAFRNELARRINAFVASRTNAASDAEPETQ